MSHAHASLSQVASLVQIHQGAKAFDDNKKEKEVGDYK